MSAAGVYVFLGPPASGKGTQAKMLSEKMSLPHIALGDILREAVRNGTDLGNKAKAFMDAGKLVPDEITIQLAGERFSKPDCKSGFIVDGFPRTLKQSDAFEGLLRSVKLEIASVIYIDIPLAAAVKRLSGRRSCKNCGAVYHVEFNPPKSANVCDRCGGELYQRKDDTEAVITTRFSVYDKETLPLVEHFRKMGKLIKVSGEEGVKEVSGKILAALKADR
jgi:adenylate kinase